MPIEVVCPSCDTSHKVKDESAGKKLKCKGCQKILSIPAAKAASDADPWENLDENEGGEELPPVVRQSAASKKKKSGKRTRSGSSHGMPVPIMVSIGINGLQIAAMVVVVIIKLIVGDFRSLGGSVRIAIDIFIINGLRERKSRVRWNAIILDAIGLGSAVFCLGPILYMSSQMGGAPAQNVAGGPSKELMIAIGVVQLIFWATDLAMLLTRSAKEYCNES